MKHELQSIISGKSKVKYGDNIQAITHYLRKSEGTSKMVEGYQYLREEEAKHLENFICENNLWVKEIEEKNYISEGSEQKVYLKDAKSVIKLNDAIFYTSWLDYLNNLLLNNYFFPDTAYHLLGFYKLNTILYAVVEQFFIEANEKTNLNAVKEFLSANGFFHKKNNDFFNPTLGIILEDLHDENVLTKDGNLFFIDTVFYLTNDFYL